MKILSIVLALLFIIFTLGFISIEIKYSDGSRFEYKGWINRIKL